MIKLGFFQLKTKGHGFTLSVEKTVEKTVKETVEGKIKFVPTGEFKTVVDVLGFYPKVEQVVNRMVVHELSKTDKNGEDLNVFLSRIDALTDALNNFKKESNK